MLNKCRVHHAKLFHLSRISLIVYVCIYEILYDRAKQALNSRLRVYSVQELGIWFREWYRRNVGGKAKPRVNLFKQPCPAIFLLMHSHFTTEQRIKTIISNSLGYCVAIITETWLHSQTPDPCIDRAGSTVYRVYHNSNSGKKQTPRSVYLYTRCQRPWYTLLTRYCSMIWTCRPFLFSKINYIGTDNGFLHAAASWH